ncbi:MAG: sulfite exporter TauE/SafE family protein [Acidobacteriota bacterium]
MHFPVSGVDCSPLLPPLVAFAISSLTASAGISGAVLLLPFQVSVLGYTSPGVSPTNLIYNIVAIPGGVYRYFREGRMMWPLTWAVLAGSVPGAIAGAIIRVLYLPNPRSFKLFAGLVLLFLGGRLLVELLRRPARAGQGRLPPGAVVSTRLSTLTRVEYTFLGETFSFSPAMMFIVSLVVGVVGGIYGIGGGAFISAFVVAVLRLPVYTIAGACLFGTFVTSIAGVASFELLGLSAGPVARPDWALGSLFGLGGLLGTYLGARLQKYLPERWIRLFLGLVINGLALTYIVQFFR